MSRVQLKKCTYCFESGTSAFSYRSLHLLFFLFGVSVEETNPSDRVYSTVRRIALFLFVSPPLCFPVRRVEPIIHRLPVFVRELGLVYRLNFHVLPMYLLILEKKAYHPFADVNRIVDH